MTRLKLLIFLQNIPHLSSKVISKITDKKGMIKTYFYFFLLFLTFQEASAQRVPRPGGGGEDIEVNGEKYSKSEIDSFYKLFKLQLKKCDPKRKVKMDFDHVFHYLFERHIETIMKDKHLAKKPDDYCHKENGNIIDCLLSKRLKQSLKTLIDNNYVKNYLKKQKGLSKKEINERIEFLTHLTEK